MNEADLYGADNDWAYAVPGVLGPRDIPEVTALQQGIVNSNRLQAARTAAFQARQQQEQALAAQRSSQQPAASQLISWPDYQAANRGADPEAVYDSYLNNVIPQAAYSQGADEAYVKGIKDWFQQQYARPPKAEKPKPPVDEGVVSNALRSLKQGFKAGTKAEEVAAVAAAGNKEALADLVATPEEEAPGPLQAFQKSLSQQAAGGLWDSAKGVIKSAMDQPQGAVDYMLHGLAASYPMLAAGIAGTAGGAAIGGPLGIATGVAGWSAGAASSEFGSQLQDSIRQEMIKEGLDPTNKATVQQFINDPEKYGKIVEPAIKKAAVNGVIAGLTAEVGGVLGAGAKEASRLRGLAAGTAAREGVTPELAAQAAEAANRLKMSGRGQLAGAIGSQPVGFGAGEVLSRQAAGMPQDDQATVLTALNGLIMAGGPVLAGRAFGGGRALLRGEPEARPPGEPGVPPGGVPPGRTEAEIAARASGVSDEELVKRATGEAPLTEPPPPGPPPGAPPAAEPPPTETKLPTDLNSVEGVRAALDLKAKGNAAVRNALELVAAGSDEQKIPALIELLRIAETGEAKYNEQLGKQAAAVIDGLLRAKFGEPLYDRFQGLAAAHPEETFQMLTALNVAQDMVKEVRNEQVKTATEQGAAAATEPPATPITPTAPAVEPGAKLKRERKARAGAAAESTAAAGVETPSAGPGEPGANAAVLPGAVAAATTEPGGGGGAGGPQITYKKRRVGLKRAEPAGVAAAGGETTAGGPVVPGGAKANAPTGVVKLPLIHWLEKVKGIPWKDYNALPKEQQDAIRAEYSAIKPSLEAEKAAVKAPGEVTIIKPNEGEAQVRTTKEDNRVGVELSPGEQEFIRSGTFTEYLQDFLKEIGLRWDQRPQWELRDGKLWARADTGDASTLRHFADWLADTTEGRAEIPPRIRSGEWVAALNRSEGEHVAPHEGENQIVPGEQVTDRYDADRRHVQWMIEQTEMRLEAQRLTLETLKQNKNPAEIISKQETAIARNEEEVAKLKNKLQELRVAYEKDRKVAGLLEQEAYRKAVDEQVANGKIPKEAIRFYKAIADGSTRDALAFIAVNSKNPLYRLVARLLLRQHIMPQTGFRSIDSYGKYWSDTDRFLVDSGLYLQFAKEGSTERMMNTVLHEALHGGTVHALSKAFPLYDKFRSGNKGATVDELKYLQSSEYKAAAKIFQLFDWLQKENPMVDISKEGWPVLKGMGDKYSFRQHYGAKNPMELAAEVFVNEELQHYLSRVRVPRSITGEGGTIRNGLEWFWNSVRELLGLTGLKALPNNALEAIAGNTLAVLRDRGTPYDQNKPIPHSTFEGETVAEATGRRALKQFYKDQEAINQEASRQQHTEEVLGNRPHDAIQAFKDGRPTYIAYHDRKNPGKYNLYQITDDSHADRSNPNGGIYGDPETRQAGLSEEQVRTLLEGHDILEARELKGGVPENNLNRMVGWVNGDLRFQANKREDGKWNVYESDKDLHDKNVKPTRYEGLTTDEMLERYDQQPYHRTEKRSNVVQAESERRDLGQYKPPSEGTVNFLDAQSPVKYYGYQMVNAVNRIFKVAVPDEQRPDVANVLKQSRAEELFKRDKHREIIPLVKQGRQLMKTFGNSQEKLSQAFTDLVVAERFPKVMQHYTPEAQREFGASSQAKLDAANQRLGTLNQAQRAALEAYAKKWKEFTNGTLDIEAKYGLKSQKSVDNIKRAYNYYAPLGEDMPSGRKGTTAQSATGEDIFEKMILQRQSAYVLGEDNAATNKLAALVDKYGSLSDDAGKPVIRVAPVTNFRRNLTTGAVEEFLDSALMSKKSVLFYRNGDPHRIIINNENLQKALAPYKGGERNLVVKKIAGAMAMFNYLYGATKTLLSPVWAFRNIARDTFTTIAQLDPDIRYSKWFSALADREVWSAAFREAASNTFPKYMDGPSPAARLAREAATNGTFVNRKSYLAVPEISSDVALTLDPSYWSKIKHAGDFEGPLFGALSVFTKTFENATRLAIYKAGRESGLSPERAAYAAKVGTVNFESRGAFSAVMNPLYVFANAKMQGIRTLSQNLGAMPDVQAKNQRTRNAAGMALGLGMLAGGMLWENSEKDKDGKKRAGKIPDYKRDNFMVVDEHLPGVPLPQELGWFYVLGNSIADIMFGDKKDKASAAAWRFATNTVQNFWPSGSAQYDPIGYNAKGSDYVLRMIMPTPAMMLYDISTNRTTFGGEIVRNKESLLKQGVPPAEMGGPNVSPLARGLARATSVLPSSFEMAPQQWEYLARQFVGPQADLVNWVAGKEPAYPGQRVNPFTKSFMPDVSIYSDQDSYRNAKQEVENAFQRWQRADPENKAAIRAQGDNDKLIRIRPEIHAIDAKINKLFQGIRKMNPEQRQQRYREAEQQATDLRTRALKRYYETTEQ